MRPTPDALVKAAKDYRARVTAQQAIAKAKAPKLPESDEIVRGTMLTRGGVVVHPSFAPQQAA